MKTKKSKPVLPLPVGYEALSPSEKLAHLQRLIQARRTPVQQIERRGTPAPPQAQPQLQQQQRTEPRPRSTARPAKKSGN